MEVTEVLDNICIHSHTSTRLFLYQSLLPHSGPGIRGTHLKSSARMKKMQESSKWLFLGNLIPEIESKAPN